MRAATASDSGNKDKAKAMYDEMEAVSKEIISMLGDLEGDCGSGQ